MKTPDEIAVEIKFRRSEIARQEQEIEKLEAEYRIACIAFHGADYVLEGLQSDG